MNQSTDNELAFLQKIAGRFRRHPQQVNGLAEADGEIIDVRKQSFDHLVTKTDSIAEEISAGLYTDAYTIGWVAVTAPVSDLAATGADLTGVLLALQLSSACDDGWLRRFQAGVNDACAAYETFIIGGDTNIGSDVSVTATAIGTVTNASPLLRKPVLPGDWLYATNGLGRGSAFAFAQFFGAANNALYKPTARLKESKIIRHFARACMDTSDCLFPALSVLAELNGTGVDFSAPLQEIFCSETKAIYEQAALPAWTLLAGPHGEYELLFAVSPQNKPAFEEACADEGWTPLCIGTATAQPTVRFISETLSVSCPPAQIANLFGECNGNIERYYQRLLQLQQSWSNEKTTVLC